MKSFVGKIITFCFLGAVGVLIITNAKGFSTAIGTVVQPLEYETSFIGTAGRSVMGTSSGSGSAQSGSSSGGTGRSGSGSNSSNRQKGSSS